jgi:hypothetical protein
MVTGKAGPGSSYTVGSDDEAPLLAPRLPEQLTTAFGQTYLLSRPRPWSGDEVLGGILCYDCDYIGYHYYGAVDLTIEEIYWITEAKTLLEKWYPRARELGKRALKYKHTPVTLKRADFPIDYINIYHYAVEILWTTLNLNRNYHVNRAFAVFADTIGARYGMIKRLWRRLKAIPAPPLVKAHALRNGTPFWMKDECEPIIRLATHQPFDGKYGGAVDYVDDVAEGYEALGILAKLDILLMNVMKAIRWLEGDITYSVNDLADWVYMTDVMDMTFDVLPGTWVQGLPDEASAPGIIESEEMFTEVFLRWQSLKHNQDQGTDQWLGFPMASMAGMNGHMYMCERGPHSPLYGETLLGWIKAHCFTSSPTSIYEDVSTPVVYLGTDLPKPAQPMQPYSTATPFGSTGVPFEDFYDSSTGWGIGCEKFVDLENSSAMGELMGYNFISYRSPLHKLLWGWDKPSFSKTIPSTWRMLDNVPGSTRQWYPRANDLGENYTTMWAAALGIPYLAK